MADRDPLDDLFDDARGDLPSAAALDALRARVTDARTSAAAVAATDPTVAGRLALTLAFCLLAAFVLLARPAATPTARSHVPHPSVSAAHGRTTAAPAVTHVAPPIAPPHDDAADTTRAPASDQRVVPTHRAAPAAVSEVELIEQAHSALATDRPADARRALERHRSLFPSGMLTEERRSLEVELAARGRDPIAAQQALTDFSRDYPGSAHLLRLQRLVRTSTIDEPPRN